MKQENLMKDHACTIPDLIPEQLRAVAEETKRALPDQQLRQIKKVLVTGCGYSYTAALWAASAFEEISGVCAEAGFSIDLSRHRRSALLLEGGNVLVIGISGSGVVARIAECLTRFTRAGAMTTAMTAGLHSKCANAAGSVIDITAPYTETKLPLRGLTMSLLAVFSIAWRMAVAKGRKTCEEYEKNMWELEQFALSLKQRLPELVSQTERFAQEIRNASLCEFVGSGPDHAAAYLGRQEMAGQTGIPGIETSTEEWFHSTFFLKNPERIGTVLFMDGESPSLTREREAEHYMLHLRRPLCVVTEDASLVEKGAYPVLVPRAKDSLWYIFSNTVVVSLLTGKLCELTGEEYSRGFRGNWEFGRDGHVIEHSEVKLVE